MMAHAHPKRVVLSGASRGIGRAIARALLARGDRLAVIGRDASALGAVVGADGQHAIITADLAHAAEAERAVERAIEALGGLDALICSAGIVEYAALEALSPEALARQLEVNFVSPLRMAQRAAGAMGEGGAMLMVASTLAFAPAKLTAAYAASKAALVSGVRSLALELGPRGIRVNAVAPGVVDTDMVRVVRLQPGERAPEGAAAQARIAEQLAALRRLHPLERLVTPEEVTYTALYLLDAEYVTGNILPVDAGLLLGAGRL
jgi:NAD(P)-dependent dehydrogenase (short-subunit alcohol dehydrogenase family)